MKQTKLDPDKVYIVTLFDQKKFFRGHEIEELRENGFKVEIEPEVEEVLNNYNESHLHE